jgi:hypothetical protein
MPLHTKKEFAAMCGMSTKTLSTYASASRRKVIYSGEFVDSGIEPNYSFLQKWQDKNRDKVDLSVKFHKSIAPPKELRMIRPLTPKEQMSENDDDEEIEDLTPPAATGLDAKKVATQIRKMEKEIEKLTLSNQKVMGQVVPVELIDALILQERQSFLMESKNTIQDILSIFAKRRDLSASERTDISTEFIDRLNEMMKRASETTEKAIKSIVSEFTLKRGKGERI